MRAVDRRAVRAGLALIVVVLASVALAVHPRRQPANESRISPNPSATAIVLAGRIVAVGTGGCPAIAITDPATGASMLRGPCGTAHLSPDGRSLLSGRSGALIVEDLATGTDRVLRSNASSWFQALGWSEGGGYVMWHRCSTSDQSCDVEHVWIGEASEAPTAADTSIYRPMELRWSADDAHVAIGENADYAPTGVWALGTGTGADRQRFDGAAPAWSRDGTLLAWTPRPRFDPATIDLMLSRADGSSPRRLATVPCCPRTLLWSPDGQRILVASPDPDAGLVTRPDALNLVALSGGAETVPWTQRSDSSLIWSPDSTRFVISGVRLGEPSRSTAIVSTDLFVIPVELPDDVVVAWSPDARELAVVGRSGGPLTIVSADDGSVRRTLDRPVPGSIDSLAWLR